MVKAGDDGSCFLCLFSYEYCLERGPGLIIIGGCLGDCACEVGDPEISVCQAR
jgi:hypothetical protein